MSELNQQEMYDAQDQQNNNGDNGGSETKKACMKCCCDYMKWSVKAVCKMFDCICHFMNM